MAGRPGIVAGIGEQGCAAAGHGHVDVVLVLETKQARGKVHPGTVVPACGAQWLEWCRYAATLGVGSWVVAVLWRVEAGLVGHWPKLGWSEPAEPRRDVGRMWEGGEGGVELCRKGLRAKSKVAA